MTARNRMLLISSAVIACGFFLFPLLIGDLGSAMLVLLILQPLTVLITSAAHGFRFGLDLRLPLLTAILFAPTVYLHYNDSAWVYAAVYAAVSMAGIALGALWKKCRK